MLNKGYNRSVDYWAFGVFLYEMLTGTSPFTATTETERIEKVLAATLVYPPGAALQSLTLSFTISDIDSHVDFNLNAKSLINQLCVVDTSFRLGMLAGGIEEIQVATMRFVAACGQELIKRLRTTDAGTSPAGPRLFQPWGCGAGLACGGQQEHQAAARAAQDAAAQGRGMGSAAGDGAGRGAATPRTPIRARVRGLRHAVKT